MKTLLLGGSGLLGTELQKYLRCDAPDSRAVNITDPELKFTKNFYDVVIHAAAYTDVVSAEVERERCFDTNVFGTYNLCRKLSVTKFVYISSEYAYDPQNFYSWTKKWAEEIVLLHPNSLIIRTSFVPRPFPHKYAFFDQYTQGDYVDVIAPMIAKEVMKGIKGIIYLGTGRKTIFDLARRTKPNIKGISVDDIKEVKLPKDYE